MNICELCGEPMAEDELHGFSGPCPKPPLVKPQITEFPGMRGTTNDLWNAAIDAAIKELGKLKR